MGRGLGIVKDGSRDLDPGREDGPARRARGDFAPIFNFIVHVKEFVWETRS